MHITELWESEALGPKLARICLLPLSWIYAGGWKCYRWIYRMGIKKAARPMSPIVCIGNLTVGGSGKTPTTLFVADLLFELGYMPVISCSGYGSPKSEAASVAPGGKLDPKVWGDEPAMMRWLRPGVNLVVGRRRVLAAKLVQQNFPGSVLLMDDGFQHLPLAKDLTVILDPANPANPHCLPAGPYREPRSNRKIADLAIPNGFRIVEEPGGFVDPAGNPIRIEQCTVLCAIGRPEGLLRSLQERNIAILDQRLLPDHDSLGGGTLLAGTREDVPIVVTAKDWVKLRERPDVNTRTFAIAQHAIRIEPVDEFRDWLQKKLHGIEAKNHPQ
jgi:tetraacyldisaccharide 4'-kinase